VVHHDDAHQVDDVHVLLPEIHMAQSGISPRSWHDKSNLLRRMSIHVTNEDEDDDVPVRQYCGDDEVM